MYKYILKFMNNELTEELEKKNLSVVEDNFDGESSFYIYTDERIDDFFKEMNVDFNFEKLENADWQNYWKKFLKPSILAEDVSCYYDENEKIPASHSIKLIPAMAFGTGTHPTTRLSSALIRDSVSGRSFLDVGCGSGILSILAFVSGAKTVYSFDNDPAAVLNAKINMRLNRMLYDRLWCGDFYSLKENVLFDVVSANIISSVLYEINQSLLEYAKSYIILSGIMKDEIDEFMNTFNFGDCNVEQIIYEDNWAAIRLRK
ncbi:MAG: methyltransferase [Flexistipes sinusarabici]|uniref:Methyltransferase n=1 Tax=Flexistipes sinusarabici TaxID=2352 RepID=A0A5D0MPC6_FLESI|nr:50S ribosomal protein L11 methyltransferase [Flexistipes sinusarabici]TYB33483.1 MAG: methyltransferase [Flexistipes sinusarabici]